MKRNFIYLIGVVCMMTSCLRGIDTPNPLKGNEVLFSATLDGAQTKTLYGEQVGNGVKVNWVHNDLITIFGSECTAVSQAEYKVATVTIDDKGNEIPATGMNSASYLSKTGAAGVQWGGKSESDFYAIYPSVGENQFTKTEDGASVLTHIRPIQRNVFTYNKDRNCWEGTPYDQDKTNLSMVDAVMCAGTHASASGDGTAINLKFNPLTTVLKFKFGGFNYSTNLDFGQTTVLSIKSIKLQAPPSVSIAGNFNLEMELKNDDIYTTATPQVEKDGKIQNEITILPNYLPLSTGQAVEFCVYTIPQDGLKLGFNEDLDLWKVTFETSVGKSFTYKLRPSSGTSTLLAGAIHNITVPSKEISIDGTLSEHKPNWVVKIPRNVYISELSLPGAWYCNEAMYTGQDTNGSLEENLVELYQGGIRAFHINCCVYNGELRCAGSNGAVRDAKVFDILKQLNSLIEPKDFEYIVVVLSIAEKVSNANASIVPSAVIPKINEMLSSAELTNLHRDKITSNTVVGDVSGKMLVLVNSNTSNFIQHYDEVDEIQGASLIAEASLSLSGNADNGIIAGKFDSMQSSHLYWGSDDKTGLSYHYHHCQGTKDTSYDGLLELFINGLIEMWSGGYDHPTLSDREQAISSIIAESDDIYKNGNHNAWYMMGIGGYLIQYDNAVGDWLEERLGEDGLVGNTTKIADDLNSYLLERINNKLRNVEGFYPSPVGIVLMNHPLKSEYDGPQLVEAIMNMNAAFVLEQDPQGDYRTGDQMLDLDAGFADVTSWDDIELN